MEHEFSVEFINQSDENRMAVFAYGDRVRFTVPETMAYVETASDARRLANLLNKWADAQDATKQEEK